MHEQNYFLERAINTWQLKSFHRPTSITSITSRYVGVIIVSSR